jgi:phosphoglucosamine mutase
MLEGNYSLGGEHSGHIILKKYATTGDGILTAIMVAEELCDKKLPLSVITKPFSLLPQHTKNLRVKDKSLTVNDRTVQEKLQRISEAIGEEGRIILRESGTEPVIRVMVEAKTDELCEKYISEMVETIEKGGFLVD